MDDIRYTQREYLRKHLRLWKDERRGKTISAMSAASALSDPMLQL